MIRKRKTNLSKRATINSCASRRRSMLRNTQKKIITRRRTFALNQINEAD